MCSTSEKKKIEGDTMEEININIRTITDEILKIVDEVNVWITRLNVTLKNINDEFDDKDIYEFSILIDFGTSVNFDEISEIEKRISKIGDKLSSKLHTVLRSIRLEMELSIVYNWDDKDE